MTDLLPDEQLPPKLDALERVLVLRQHQWFASAMLLAALATGVTLLLPWTFSRRLGLSVWQLGIETQPTLALTWAAALITTILTLALPPGPKSQTTAAITAVITLIYLAACWQSRTLPLTDTWPGPGPTVALTTTTLWLLTTTAHLLSARLHPTPPTDDALTTAQSRLHHLRPHPSTQPTPTTPHWPTRPTRPPSP